MLCNGNWIYASNYILLIPGIIFHGVFNSLSIFSTGESSIISSIILIAMCLGYTIYINKKVKA